MAGERHETTTRGAGDASEGSFQICFTRITESLPGKGRREAAPGHRRRLSSAPMAAPRPMMSIAAYVNRRWPEFRGEQPLVAAFFVALAMLACLVSAQPDTFWQLRAGRDIVATGHVALLDRYSYTAAGQFWPDHEWLWQVLTYLCHAAGGMPLVTAFSAALVVAAVGLAYRLTAGPTRRRLVIVAAAVLLSGSPWSVRPQLATHLLLMATFWALDRRRPWLLPPLFALWVNVHGAVVLGFVLIGAALVAAALDRDGRAVLRMCAVGLLCFAATFASPLGARLYAFIGESMAKSRLDGVAEWQPALSLSPRAVAFWLAAAALVVATAPTWSRLSRREDRFAVVAALAFIPLGARAVRNIMPFALVLAPAASRLAAVWDGASPPHRGRGAPPVGPSPAANVAELAAIALVAAGCVAAAWLWPLPLLAWTPVSPAAAAAIRACPERLYNSYDQGGPLIWFVPEKPVFIDGRQDPYPTDFLRRAMALPHDERLRRATFAEYGIHCAALAPESNLLPRLRAEGWRERHRDEQWVVSSDQ
jgi:hypothetical protein